MIRTSAISHNCERTKYVCLQFIFVDKKIISLSSFAKNHITRSIKSFRLSKTLFLHYRKRFVRTRAEIFNYVQTMSIELHAVVYLIIHLTLTDLKIFNVEDCVCLTDYRNITSLNTCISITHNSVNKQSNFHAIAYMNKERKLISVK